MQFRVNPVCRKGIFDNGLQSIWRENKPWSEDNQDQCAYEDEKKLHFVFKNERSREIFMSSGFSKDFFMVTFFMVRTMGAFSMR